MTMPESIRAAMKSQGITAYRLAKLSHVGESALSAFFRGKRELRSAAIERIANVLEIELAHRPRTKRRDE